MERKTDYTNISVTTEYLERKSEGKEKATCLLLHDGGFGTTAELCWKEVIPLIDRRVRILAPDLLGWGGTDKMVYCGDSPYGFRLKHIKQFVVDMEVKNLVVVGASFGGSLALRAVIDMASEMNIIGGISISGTAGLYRNIEAFKKLGNYRPSLEAARNLTNMIVHSQSDMSEHYETRYQNSMIKGHWEALMVPSLSNPSASNSLRDNRLLDELEAVNIPVLLIEGTHDPLLEKGWAQQMSQHLKLGRSYIMEAGHEPNIDYPEKTAEIINQFVLEIAH